MFHSRETLAKRHWVVGRTTLVVGSSEVGHSVVRWTAVNLLSGVPVASSAQATVVAPTANPLSGAQGELKVASQFGAVYDWLIKGAQVQNSNVLAQLLSVRLLWSISSGSLRFRDLCFVCDRFCPGSNPPVSYNHRLQGYEVHLSNDPVAQDAYICHSQSSASRCWLDSSTKVSES